MRRNDERSIGAVRIVRTATTTLAMACALLVAPSLAGAADITVNDDATGPGPAGSSCATPDHATIQAAINAAAPSGDRILVCAGTYNENQVLIGKSVDLIGAGRGLSIIDGGNAETLPASGLVRLADTTNGNVLVQGFTLRNPGNIAPTIARPDPARFAIALKGNDPGFTYDFNELEVIGRGAGGRDYGFYADNVDNDVVLRNSSITGTAFNPILIERVDGATTIRDNVVSQDGSVNTSAIFIFTHSGDGVTAPVRVLRNSIDANGFSGIAVQSLGGSAVIPATFNSIEIRDNVVQDFSTSGISLVNADPTASGANGEIANVAVEGNTLRDREEATASRGIRIQGRVRNVSLRSNMLVGLTSGITVDNATAGHGATGVQAHFNRIAGNSNAGLVSNVTEPINAELNWWGCNEGPNQPGCDAVTGSGPVDFDPWLVLGLTATPTSIETGGDTSRLEAILTTDSDGNPAGPGFPEGTPIAFSTTLGSVTSPVGTADGVATSTLSSDDQAGTADVTASLDGESVLAQVEIVDPPPEDPETTIDSGPAEGSTTDDRTPTFEFSSDDPAATFECRFDDADFGPCSGPGASHTPSTPLSEGIHTFEVRAVDADSNRDESPASRTFLVEGQTEPRPGPGPGTAPELDLLVDPKKVRTQAPRLLRYTATVRNTGGGGARNVIVCIRVPKKLELKSERCKRLGRIAAGSEANARFRVKVGKDAPARLYRIKIATGAAGVDRDDRTRTKLRVLE